MIDENIVKRLAFVRYLYSTAVEQSQLPEPMCASSVLTFHDAVELFLLLACKYKDTAPPQSFMDYWEKLDIKLSDDRITQKQGMKELDKARANLKHFGIIPVRDNIQEYSFLTRRFFEENTPIVFDVEFERISMVDLVHEPLMKADLEAAEELSKQGDFEKAVGKVAVAFDRLLRRQKERNALLSGLKWPGAFSPRPATYKFGGSSGRSKLDDYSKKMFGDILEQTDALRKAVEPMQDAMVALALGLDYGRYCTFLELTPPVAMMRAQDEESVSHYRTVPTPMYDSKRPRYLSPDSYRFCFDFVIEAVTRSQLDVPSISFPGMLRRMG